MKKNELLSMRKLFVTPDMEKTVKNDKYKEHRRTYQNFYGTPYTEKWKQYTYYLFFRAEVKNDILKVSIFTRKWIINGNNNPQFDVYISKKEDAWLVYDNEEQKWRKAKIDYLHFDTGERSYVCETKNYQEAATRKLVNDYLGTGNMDVKEAVLQFQANIRGAQLEKRHRSELEQIDAVMNEVPELPKDFENWIRKKAFIKDEYLLYRRKSGKAEEKCYCTHCENWMEVPDEAEHNKNTTCPKCRTRVKLKAWNKQKYLVNEKTVGILQKLNDGTGYIIRRFNCKVKRTRENEWQRPEVYKFEEVRARIGTRFEEAELFEYGEYKYTGINRWCHECRKSGFGYYNRTFGSVILYTKNLKRELRHETFARMDLKRLFHGDKGIYVNPGYLLQKLYQYPFLEYLQKTGLNKLTQEIIKSEEDGRLFDKSASKLTNLLQIDKQRINRLKQIDGGCDVLRALQYEQQSKQKITEENLKYITANKINIDSVEMERTEMNLCKTLNYLKRQQELNRMSFADTKRHYSDYLDMAAERGMDLTDEIICKNSRMIEYHDRYVEEKNRIQDKKRDNDVNRRFASIRKDYEQNKKHFEWREDGYVILVPHQASDITREGRQQHHCVGSSDTYMRRMNERTTFILFLRKEKEEKKPWYTLEVKWNGEKQQAYAAYDRTPDFEIVEKVLKSWKKELRKRIRKEEQEKTKEIRLQVAVV